MFCFTISYSKWVGRSVVQFVDDDDDASNKLMEQFMLTVKKTDLTPSCSNEEMNVQ